MNCEWFETRLDELLDERRPPDGDAELNKHAGACPRCAQLLSDHQALLEAMDAFVRPHAGGYLGMRVLAELKRGPVSMPAATIPMASLSLPLEPSQRLLRPAAAWIAATIAVGLFIVVGMMQWGKVYRAAPDAEKVTDLGSRNLGIDGADSRIATENSKPIAIHSIAGVPSLSALMGSPQRIWFDRALMEQMSSGLTPVTHSMSAALNALRRTLPGSETSAHSS